MITTDITLKHPLINKLRQSGVCSESGFYLSGDEVKSHKTSSDLSNRERQFLSLAIKVARTSEANKQHGCAIVKNGSVLSLGTNKWRNRGSYNDESVYNPYLTVHAEIDALANTKNVEGAVVYIARLGNKGDLRYSRPCKKCFKRLMDAGVKRVIYTNDVSTYEMHP